MTTLPLITATIPQTSISVSSAHSLIGQPAPNFVLPSIQGETIHLAHYHGQAHVILWFSRGFTCPFCRGHMDNIISHYEQVINQEAVIVQVAPNLHESAQTFFREQAPPYPFVCDPDKRLYATYGIGDRGVLEATRNTFVSFGTAASKGDFGNTVRASWLDVSQQNFLRRLHHHALTALDQVVVFIDKQGIVRHTLAVGTVDPIPSAVELIHLLKQATQNPT